MNDKFMFGHQKAELQISFSSCSVLFILLSPSWNISQSFTKWWYKDLLSPNFSHIETNCLLFVCVFIYFVFWGQFSRAQYGLGVIEHDFDLCSFLSPHSKCWGYRCVSPPLVSLPEPPTHICLLTTLSRSC